MTLPASSSQLPAPSPRKLLTTEYPFNEAECDRCNAEWGMNCGPAALAMILGLRPNDVRAHIPDFGRKEDGKKPYTSPTMMKAALASLGVKFHQGEGNELWPVVRERNAPLFPVNETLKTDDFPRYGLARIQFEGPWMKEGVPIQARYRYTHWVGSAVFTHGACSPREMAGGEMLYIFDVNSGWSTYVWWRDHTMPDLTKETKRATGEWHVTHRWQLELSS